MEPLTHSSLTKLPSNTAREEALLEGPGILAIQAMLDSLLARFDGYSHAERSTGIVVAVVAEAGVFGDTKSRTK